MARKKRTSKALENAEIRLSALKAIDQSLNLGGDLTLEFFSKFVAEMNGMIDNYNTALSELDSKTTKLVQMEKEISTLSTRMLAGVAARYGKDSLEYEKAGGVRTSEIKRKPRSTKSAKS